MGFLSASDILAARAPRTEVVENVPDWGGDVRIKVMSGTERDAFESDVLESRGKDVKVNYKNYRAKLAVYTLCNEQGERLFANTDAAKLGETSSVALDVIAERATKLNRIGRKEVEDLVKNSDSDPSDSAT